MNTYGYVRVSTLQQANEGDNRQNSHNIETFHFLGERHDNSYLLKPKIYERCIGC
jgi:DNA invertase Pin-like site-specific DNA recombinase